MQGFWIYQASEYARVLIMLLVLNTSRQSYGYNIALNIPGLHRGFEYAWMIPAYAWLCLNVPKSAWMAFVLHLPIVISYLKKPQTVFLESKSLIFFYSNWKYLILFIGLD